MNNYENRVIGGNPLPVDAQQKLAEFLDWFGTRYEIKGGSTALYWFLSYEIYKRIEHYES